MAVGQVGSILHNTTTAGEEALAGARGAAQGGIGAAASGLAQAQGVGREIDAYLGRATGLADNAAKIVNGADADVDAMRALVPQIGSQVSGISKSADSLSNLAALLTGKAGDVSAYAPAVAGLGNDLLGRIGLTDALAGQTVGAAYALQPHANALTGIADVLFGQGRDMVGRANTVLGQGQGLINLDASSSPLAAEWVKLLASVNPDAYAARAGADVQSQSDSAYQQQLRELARRGVSLSSGASAAIQRQFKTSLAMMKAAAMTRGRQTGYDKTAAYTKEIGDLANTLLGTGTSMFNAGVTAENAAATQRKNAADVQKAMGDLFAKGAEIFGIGNSAVKGAGDLFGAAAGIEEGAGKLLSSAAGAESASTEARGRAITGLNAQAGIHSDAAGKQIEQGRALNDTANVHQQNAQVKNQYLSNLNDANRTVVGAYGTLATALNQAASYYGNLASSMIAADARQPTVITRSDGAVLVGNGKLNPM